MARPESNISHPELFWHPPHQMMRPKNATLFWFSWFLVYYALKPRVDVVAVKLSIEWIFISSRVVSVGMFAANARVPLRVLSCFPQQPDRTTHQYTLTHHLALCKVFWCLFLFLFWCVGVRIYRDHFEMYVIIFLQIPVGEFTIFVQPRCGRFQPKQRHISSYGNIRNTFT